MLKVRIFHLKFKIIVLKRCTNNLKILFNDLKAENLFCNAGKCGGLEGTGSRD